MLLPGFELVNTQDYPRARIAGAIAEVQPETWKFRAARLSQLQLESLLFDLSTPLTPLVLLHKREAVLLVEVSCGVETLKGP